MTYPLTVSMTPAFYSPGDWLLKAQLRCLSEQTNKDFDVYVIDPHYSKRVNLIPELAVHYRLALVHIPYKPNVHIAKRLDCAVFNAAYCYSESPRIVRYSCWRFVRPDFTDICLTESTNVDFYYHDCSPPTRNTAHPETNHNTDIWNFGSDEVHWNMVPESGQPGASWGPDRRQPAQFMPPNCYGNYMIFRDQWLRINGCNEVFTNNEHYEDVEFCIRARNARMQCSRVPSQMYRLQHRYGSYSGRANAPPDWSFKSPCRECQAAHQVESPNRYDLKNRLAKGQIEILPDQKAWICKTCFLSGSEWYSDPGEHTSFVARSRLIRATILPKYKIGRNLRILTEDMDGKRLVEKIAIFNDSWDDPKYYQP